MRDSREKGAGMRDQNPPFQTLIIEGLKRGLIVRLYIMLSYFHGMLLAKSATIILKKKAASRALLDELIFLICKTKIEKIIFFLSSGGGRYVVTFE